MYPKCTGIHHLHITVVEPNVTDYQTGKGPSENVTYFLFDRRVS